MKFSELSEYFETLENTSSRNSMTEQLAELFTIVGGDEIETVCYLALGRLAPLYERVDFNLAEKMVIRSIVAAFEADEQEVSKEYKKVGDLGALVQAIKKEKSEKEDPEGMSVNEVYNSLMSIAMEEGSGSQDRKTYGLASLLTEVNPLSAKYVVRIILGKLRLGFSDKTILDALSVMDTGSKVGRKMLDSAYQVFPNVGRLAQLVKEHGIEGVDERVSVTLGVPVLPALAQRLKTPQEMIKKMGTVIAEPKYDGTRVQVHLRKAAGDGEWKVKTFTRNLDETTHMFPELKSETVLEQLTAESVILDSEAVGVDPKTGELLPFQMTITRKRKHDIAGASKEVPLKFFVYDILYKDGESLVKEPFQKRRELLKETVKEGEILRVAPAIVTDDPQVLRTFHAEQLAKGLEGALVKKIDAPYRSGRRGWTWVKFKEVEDADGKLSDTVDAVVMGFYRGKGKRAQFGIGAFLIGLKNTSSKKIETIAKVGTGLSDEQWVEMRKRLEKAVSLEQPKEYSVDKGLFPDVWVDPSVVVEVAADEVTQSPNHSAGVALRFPRLIRFRDDKSLEQATTTKELLDIQKAS